MEFCHSSFPAGTYMPLLGRVKSQVFSSHLPIEGESCAARLFLVAWMEQRELDPVYCISACIGAPDDALMVMGWNLR